MTPASSFMGRKHLILLYCLLSLLMFSKIAKAINAGGELSYTWVSDSTYRFYFKYYRDCGSSGTVPYSQTLCVVSTCNSILNFNTTMNLYSGPITGGNTNGSPVATSCPAYPTKCQNAGSSIPGLEEWWYTCVVTLPAKCALWKFTVLISPRNTSTNISGGDLYVEATLNNQQFQGNSSAYFTVSPLPYMCLNVPATYNAGAVDPNTDSLVTEVFNPQTNSNCFSTPSNIGFNTGSPAYTIPANPFQTNTSFVVNSVTGMMSFTPTLAGQATLATRVKEYRNGVMAGSIIRDVQYNIINSCSGSAPAYSVANITGGGNTGGVIYGCTEQTITFCFDIKSPGTNIKLLLSDNHGQSIPGSMITYSNQNSDSVRGCFNWYPSASDSGQRVIVITAKDSSCTAPGIVRYYNYTIPIYIWPPVRALKDTAICQGTSTTLTAVNGASFNWSVLPGGSSISSLSCTSCTSPVVTPTITTTYRTISTGTAYCPNNFDIVTITVLNTPKFTPLKDTVNCPHTSIQFDLLPTPPTGETYTYTWTPSTYLNNNLIYNPIAINPGDITYTVTITTNNNCVAYDTVNIDVLDGFTILTQDTAICIEELASFTATGDSRYTYKWSSNAPNTTITGPTTLHPTIQTLGVGKYFFKLTASFPGCADSTDSVSLDIQPYPGVIANKDLKLCLDDSIQLINIVNPTGYPFTLRWTPGSLLSDSTTLNPYFYGKAQGTYKRVLKAWSSAGCSDSDDVIIQVALPGSILELLTQDTAICRGDSAQLRVAHNGLKSVRWEPAFNISDTSSFEPFVTPHGDIIYTVYSIDTSACADTQSVRVTVKPEAFVYMPDTVDIYPGESYKIDPDGNCLYFKWQPSFWLNNAGIQTPITTPKQSIQYTLTASTEFGCSINDTINIRIRTDSYIEIPNAFTPGTKLNPVFNLLHRGNISLKRFSIYNRWGTKVFETANPNDGWDGTFNGELQPMGVYIYIVEATMSDGSAIMKKGNVTLIR